MGSYFTKPYDQQSGFTPAYSILWKPQDVIIDTKEDDYIHGVVMQIDEKQILKEVE